MAFPSIRSQTASAGESGNTTSHTISYPATITAGDTLLCFVASDGDNTFDWAAAETSRGWVKLYEVSSADNQTCLSVGYIKASGSETGTFELASSQNEESQARMFAIQAAADPTVTPPDVSASNASSGSTTVTFNTCTPAGGSADFLWFVGIGYDDDDGGMTSSFPTNYDTNKAYDISGTGAGTGSLDTSYRTNAAASESPGNGTAATNEEWVSAVVAVHPVGSTDRAAKVTAFELEVPNAPRKAKVTAFELETPNADRKAKVTAFELETTDAGRQAKVTAFELESPDAARKAKVTAFEFETENAARKAKVTAFEFETEVAGRQAKVTAFELEVPTAPRKAKVTAFEFEVPGAPRKAKVTAFELEVPQADRKAKVTAFELQTENAARKAKVTAFELEIGVAARRAKVTAFELETPVVAVIAPWVLQVSLRMGLHVSM